MNYLYAIVDDDNTIIVKRFRFFSEVIFCIKQNLYHLSMGTWYIVDLQKGKKLFTIENGEIIVCINC
jgi:hypothetical protein